MSNVLSTEKKQQVISLGKLGWSLRRIEEATGVRRETASVYLKAAGVAVCLPGWGRRAPAKPAIQVTPASGAKPAIVTPDFFAPFSQHPDAPSAPSPPSASVCEEYRERIEQGMARGRNGKAIWQDLVSDHGFVGDYQAVKRFEALCAQASWTATSGSRRHHPPRTRRRSASRLRQWSDGARSENRQVSPDTTVCSDPWLQPQVRAPAGVAFEYAHLGRTPREGVSSFRGLSESGGSRQPGRRCGGSRHLRSHHQPAVSRCARALRRGSAALPDPRSRSQRESGIGRRPREENPTQRDALREPGRSASVSRPLGRTLGRYTHPWHHQTPGCRHVRGRKTAPASTASGTFPLLPIRRTCSASGWLCGSGSCLLQFAAGMDRTSGEGAMG